MPELKSPMFIAGLVITTVFVVVIIMLYRTVSSLKSSVFAVVEQHNNAKGVLDSHDSALKRIEDVLVGDEEYDDDDDDDDDDMPTMKDVTDRTHTTQNTPEHPTTKKSK